MKKVFRVADMECPNCAMRLESIEDDLEGVNLVSASYRKLQMEVDFDEKKVSIDQILQAVIKKGYHAEAV
jgi:copper chaperone CopZ